MKQIPMYFGIVIIFLFSCSNPTEIQHNNARLEGTVVYFVEEMAIGGEVDPSGFILTDPKWNFGEPSYAYRRIYLTGLINPAYIQRHVSVEGEVDTLIIRGVERGIRYFPVVEVSIVKIID
jgi:hypothetical protein